MNERERRAVQRTRETVELSFFIVGNSNLMYICDVDVNKTEKLLPLISMRALEFQSIKSNTSISKQNSSSLVIG